MSAEFVLWLFAVSIGASALGGMLGMAGGIFIVPILTMLGHVEIHTAIGASIVSVIACSCSSASSYLGEGLTNIRLAIVLEVATTLGALTGVLMAGIIPFRDCAGCIRAADAGEENELAEAPPPAGSRGWSETLGLDSSYLDRASGGSVN